MAALVVVLAGGCNSVHTLHIAAPPRSMGAPTTTTAPAVASTVPEAPVGGSSPSGTSVAIKPGLATINGTALGPSGPVEGATVEIERFVGDSTAKIEATTAADGSFNVPGILGGRYVVRAWESPSLAETTPHVFFLTASGTETLNLQMTSYSGLKVATALNPEVSFTGQPVNLAVEVTQPTVDENGDVNQVPQVSVTVRLESTNFIPFGGGPAIATTGLNGEAILGITCTRPGTGGITLLVGGSTTVAVNSAFCVDSESTTTTTHPTTTVTVPTTPVRSTTTTTPPTTAAPTTTPVTTIPTPTVVLFPTTTAPSAPSTTSRPPPAGPTTTARR